MKRAIVWGVVYVAMAAPAAAQVDVVEACRARYPKSAGLSAEEKVGLLQCVAATLNEREHSTRWGLVPKSPPSTNCLGFSCDHVCETLTNLHYDVLVDQDGPARPTWDSSGSNPWGCRPVGGSPAPTPTPTPVPVPVPTPVPTPVPPVDWAAIVKVAVAECTAQAAACTEQITEHRKESKRIMSRVMGSWQTYAVIGAALASWYGGKAASNDTPASEAK